VNRFVEPPVSGVLCDILWADPARVTARRPVSTVTSTGASSTGSGGTWGAVGDESSESDTDEARARHWRPNEARGCSFFFSEAAARKFLKRSEAKRRFLRRAL